MGYLTKLFRFALVPALAGGVLSAASLEGDWSATLVAGPQKLRLMLHIAEAEGGALTATFDSLDQGATGIPIDSVQLDGDRLTFAMDRLGARFEGMVAEDGDRISGTWSQGPASFPLEFERASGAAPRPGIFGDAALAPLLGVWQGAISAGGQSIRIVLRVERTGDDYLVVIDSPDSGAQGIPVSNISLEGTTLRFTVQAAGGTYEGTLDETGESVAGEWSQAGRSTPLELKKGENAPAARRPQHPKLPYPYQTAEVKFPGGSQDVTLAGTLTWPEGREPVPGLVLVSGSGPQDRDETVMGHKPFLVLADALTRRGLAVLRYDDRGVGESTGDFSAATTADFTADARAAVDYLGAHDGTAGNRVGIMGHSEGATVAAMVAGETKVAFVVLLAPPGVPGEEVILSQIRRQLEMNGATEESIENRVAAMAKLYDMVRNGATPEQLSDHIAGNAPAILGTAQAGPSASAAVVSTLTSPWVRHFLSYDPASALTKLRVPVLALFGEKDVQVIPDLNARPVRKALAGNEKAMVEVLPGLNHLFQESETGAVSEYARIEQTISPGAIAEIADWVVGVVGER